jgi:hypothetical protein
MKLRKVISVVSDIDGYSTVDSLKEAKQIANQNIKNGIRTSIYVDYFDTDEDLDPVKSEAYFTNDECTKLYKSKY